MVLEYLNTSILRPVFETVFKYWLKLEYLNTDKQYLVFVGFQILSYSLCVQLSL